MLDFIHFIGIGGIGVSALAHVAAARGARVSGSDSAAEPDSNPALARLIAEGAVFHRGHRAENIAPDVTLVVATAAVDEENPEIIEARARGIRLVSRAAYLGELMATHPGPRIAVAGTHGKTTTTGMIGVMLQQAGLDPTVFVGGEVAQLGGNVRIGSPEGPFVAEACEAYDSFLYLRPDIAVITNVEADHLDHYESEAGVFAAFARFLKGVSDTGSIIGCGDDDGVRKLLGSPEREFPARVHYYGVDCRQAGVSAASLELGRQPRFILTVPEPHRETGVRLQVPGLHNVQNALAAATVGLLSGLTPEEIAGGLEAFRGAGRRQDILGTVQVSGGEALVVDDYAHHPTEIQATLNALRDAYPGRRVIVIFQPHLYSRTRDFLDGFARTLAGADVLIVTDIYAAREAPIPGVTSAGIVERAREQEHVPEARYVPDKRSIPGLLAEIVQAGDLIVFMGAGDIREEGEAFVSAGRVVRTSA